MIFYPTIIKFSDNIFNHNFYNFSFKTKKHPLKMMYKVNNHYKDHNKILLTHNWGPSGINFPSIVENILVKWLLSDTLQSIKIKIYIQLLYLYNINVFKLFLLLNKETKLFISLFLLYNKQAVLYCNILRRQNTREKL